MDFTRGLPEEIGRFKSVKIRWVREAKPEAFMEKDDLVIVMQRYENQDRNFLQAILAYVSNAFMRESKAYMSPLLTRAMQLVLAREIIGKHRETALPMFDDEVLSNERKTKEIDGYCQELYKLSKTNYLMHIMVPEVNELACRARMEMPSQEHWDEVEELCRVLNDLVGKPPDVDINPNINTKNIKISIVMVARAGKFFSEGPTPWTTWILGCLEKGIERFYILAREKKEKRAGNISVAKVIRDQVIRLGVVKKISETEYEILAEDSTVLKIYVLRLAGSKNPI